MLKQGNLKAHVWEESCLQKVKQLREPQLLQLRKNIEVMLKHL